MQSRRSWLAGLLGLPLAASTNAPRKSPELAVQLDSGGELKLSSLRGKVVCVEFLLTTCPHCRRCSLTLQKMLDEFGPRGFAVLGAVINRDMRPSKYAESLQLKFPVGATTTEAMLEYLQWHVAIRGVPMMPQLVFIDRAGNIHAQHAGDSSFVVGDLEQNLRGQIAELLRG